LQITDYGLPSFLAGQNFDENEHDTFRRKWFYADFVGLSLI